jgi:hypothetical protein
LLRVLLGACPFCFLQYAALPTCYNYSLFFNLEFMCCFYKPSPLQAHCGGGEVLPLLSSPAGLFTHSSSGDCSSPTLWSSGCPALFAKCLFFQLLVYYTDWFFPLFSLGGGQSVQGLIWFTVCHLAHLVVCVFPSSLGAGVWWCGSPPVFSVYHGVGMLCVGWGCGGVEVLPLLGGFSCKVYLQHLSKILL